MSYQQIQNSLLRLVTWPELSRLPQELMVDVARVCALLSWRATAGVLVPRILDMPKERAQEVLSLLNEQGCFNISATPADEEADVPDVTTDEPAASSRQVSLISKIWGRLAGRG